MGEWCDAGKRSRGPWFVIRDPRVCVVDGPRSVSGTVVRRGWELGEGPEDQVMMARTGGLGS